MSLWCICCSLGVRRATWGVQEIVWGVSETVGLAPKRQLWVSVGPLEPSRRPHEASARQQRVLFRA